jgi:hypothetical protein
VVAEDRRAVGRRQPGGVEEILDPEGDSLTDPLGDGQESVQIVVLQETAL